MSMKYIIQFLIVGTRGGLTRTKILKAIQKTPQNMNQLAKELKMDYKTIQHHLRVLVENRILSVIKKGSYGAIYHISPEMEAQMYLLEEIWEKNGEK